MRSGRVSLLTLALVCTGVVLPGAASAQELLDTEIRAQAGFSGAEDCVASGDSFNEGPYITEIPGDGQPTTTSAGGSATFTDPRDPEDVTEVASWGTTTISVDAGEGDARGFAIHTRGRIDIESGRATGRRCDVEAYVGASVRFVIEVPSPRVLDIATSGGEGTGYALFVSELPYPGKGMRQKIDVNTGPSAQQQSVVLPAGSYYVYARPTVSASQPPGAMATSSVEDVVLKGELRPPNADRVPDERPAPRVLSRVASASNSTSPRGRARSPLRSSNLLSVADMRAVGPLACTAVGPGPEQAGPRTFTADGRTRTQAVRSHQTFTSVEGTTDASTSASSVVANVLATSDHGSLTSFTAATHYDLDIRSEPEGNRCGAIAQGWTATSFEFAIDRPRRLTIRDSAAEQASYSLQLQGLDSQIWYAFSSYGAMGSSDRGEVTLPAGTYAVDISHSGHMYTPWYATRPSAWSGELRLTAVLTPPGAGPGVNLGAATGRAARYLALPGQRGCVKGTIRAVWRREAGRGADRNVRRALLLVNGARSKTLQRPRGGQVTVLRGLPAAEVVVVTARLRLESGRRMTATRSYAPC